MPSGSTKDSYTPEQYTKQLEHSRKWKRKNRERQRKYNREYNLTKGNGSGNDRSIHVPDE